MLDLADVIIAFLGGIGTLDEITEVHCLSSINQTSKFVGILNSQNFYIGLLVHYEQIKRFEFSSKDFLKSIVIEENPSTLAETILIF